MRLIGGIRYLKREKPRRSTMAKPLDTDALWDRIEPLLPPHKPRRCRFPGKRPLMAATGVLP